ncbi:coiled-coil domain-containing protein 63-like [Rhopilema esculentum]|uniref:coiled-coil domain-containing protein 63-like n=1 Tax=Rhopilema esculentum TaxID=499914 RepID=UPI0031CF6814|eukprot:gene4455-20698_t
MPRVQSGRSDMSEVEPDGLAEQELTKLQQQYRIMEGDRKSYSEESQNQIRKQRAAIEALQLENEELMKENRLAGSQQNRTKDYSNVEVLNALMSDEEKYKERMQSEKEMITQLDSEIYAIERKISKQRKNMGGVHMSQAKQIMIQKQSRVLENRLDQASTKFNDSLAKNRKLREHIDHVRTEREIFEGLYKRLEKQMNENKQEIAEMIEASTTAYDARDDAKTKMLALTEKSDKDLAQHNMELKELMRIIDHDRKLKEFMGIKSEDRSDAHEGAHTSGKASEAKETDDTIESYEAAFDKIKKTTKIDDIDLLVEIFIEVEDKNFALFNYVNELNNEIEMLQEGIAGIENDVEQFKRESVELEQQRKDILWQLEERHASEAEKARGFDDTYKAANKILEQLKAGIDSLFKKINCDQTSIVDMLGGHAGVTDSNMMQYLGIIEQRTNELLQVQAFAATKDEDKAHALEAIGLLGKGPHKAQATMAVPLPSTGEDYESDISIGSDDESRPLTQSELISRIMKGISKRENAPKKIHATLHQSLENINEEKSSSKKKKGAK